MLSGLIRFAAIAGFLISSVANAADAFPPLGAAKLVMFESLNTTHIINLPAIATHGCREPSLEEAAVILRCDVPAGSQFTIDSPNGESISLAVDGMVYMYQSASRVAEAQNQYFFKGVYAKVVDGITISSPFSLVINASIASPEKLAGYFQLHDLGVMHQLAGTQLD